MLQPAPDGNQHTSIQPEFDLLLIGALVTLPLLALVACTVGCLVIRSGFESWSEAFAIRTLVGFIVLATFLCFLGLIGLLRPLPVAAGSVLVVVAAFATRRRIDTPQRTSDETRLLILLAVAFTPLALVAAYPATAFDETLYHLPAVRRFAATGALPFIPELRMPVFPHFQEVLQVPLLWLGDGQGTHAVSLLSAMIVAILLFELARKHRPLGMIPLLAPALFLGAPIAAHLATSGYVEMLMAALVIAALFCAERSQSSNDLRWPLLAGAFTGSAASVKYLGLYWVAAVFVALAVMSKAPMRLRNALAYVVAVFIVALPWYGRILFYTGNPLFPFAPSVFGPSEWTILNESSGNLLSHVRSLVMAPWDGLFNRPIAGWQPHLSPFLVLCLPLIFFCRTRFLRLAFASAILFCIIWTWLPRDVRYLVPVMAIFSLLITATLLTHLPRTFKASGWMIMLLIAIVLLPGPAWGIWRMKLQGPLPTNREEAAQFLRRRIPQMNGIEMLNRTAAPGERAFVCGGEDLFDHFTLPVMGDFYGPARYEKFEGRDSSGVAAQMRDLQLHYIVVMKADCPILGSANLPGSPPFQQVYDDAYVAIARRRH